MKFNYSRPPVEVKTWLVSKEDIKRIYSFFSSRSDSKLLSFTLDTASGNNRDYDSFEEFENDLDKIKAEKEEIRKIQFDAGSSDDNGRGHVFGSIDFKYQTANFYVTGSDSSGARKDWIDGTYEEMKRVFRSFYIDDEKSRSQLLSWYGRKYIEGAVFEDFLGEKRERLDNYQKSLKGVSSIDGKIEQSKQWHENPLGILFLAVASGLLVTYLAFIFGWI